jgi:putative hydrolase of the HAD superfamily
MTLPLRALIFDLDDTLLVDEAVSKEVLAEITAPLAASCHLDSRIVVEKTILIARQLWSEGPCHSFCRSIGISALECLWGNFLGESPELCALRTWALEYRNEVFRKVLLTSKQNEISVASCSEKMAIDFVSLRRARQRLFAETFSLIEQFSGHYKLGLLTNGAPDLQREKIVASGLEAFFSVIVISGEHGIGKPDPAIFHLLLKQLDVEPEEALMIGNSLERDIAGARAAGVRSVWIELPEAHEESAARPDFTIKKLEELLPILSQVS